METQSFHHSTDIETDLRQYRRFSILAIFSLILGLFSVTALLHPVLWAVPGLGVVFSLVAIIAIRRHQEQLSGRLAAVLGLALSLLFLGWGLGAFFSTRWILGNEGRVYTEEWLSAFVQGNVEKAHQGHLHYSARQPDQTDLKRYYLSENHQKQLAEFLDQPALRKLSRFTPKATIKHLRQLGVANKTKFIGVAHVFEIQEGPNRLKLQIQSERVVVVDKVFWSIVRIGERIDP